MKKNNGRGKHTLDTAGFVDGAGDRLILSLKRKAGPGFMIALRHREGESWHQGFLTDQLATEAQARKEFSVRVEDAERAGWLRSRRAVALVEIPAAKPASAAAHRLPPPRISPRSRVGSALAEAA